jgi:cap2 methyltransferase
LSVTYSSRALLAFINRSNLVSLRQATGDGGIDCAGDPGEQELLVADLVMAEALVAMSCLRQGGNLVLKIFTVFESQTVCLLYLLSLAFDKVVVHKPLASKPGNSEMYLLCFGYDRAEAGSLVAATMTYFGN